MAIKFSDDPSARGFFQPNRFEANVLDCEVEGEVPAEINGTFYRVGPDRQYPARYLDDAPFNGDGMVSMFRFKNGVVDYRSRYVHTQRFVAERKARKALFGLYRNQYTSDPSVRSLSMGTANTNIYFHAGKLLALKEDSPPIAINPHTLETEGDWSFGGKLTSPTFTAHPKTDPVTGEMICFGYEAKGDASTDVAFYSVDKSGRIIWETWFKAPFVSMMHDFALTQKHILIPTNGFETSVERLKRGEIHWKWDATRPTYLGVLERGGDGKDIRWFKGPERAMIHTVNAVTEGNKIILDAPISDGNPFPFFPSLDGSPFEGPKSMTNLRRWVLDLSSKDGTWEESLLFPKHQGTGLPRMDDRSISIPYRYAFSGYRDGSKPFDAKTAGEFRMGVTNTYGKFDVSTGAVSSFFVGSTHSLQECCFVPRKKGASEGDGYLIGVASNFAEMKSELVIVDTASMEEVGRVKLPFRLYSQIHGNWVAGDDLAVA